MTFDEYSNFNIVKMQNRVRRLDNLIQEVFTPDYIEGYKIDNRKFKDLLNSIIHLQSDIINELATIKDIM